MYVMRHRVSFFTVTPYVHDSLLRDRDVEESLRLWLWGVVHVYVMRHRVSLPCECDVIIPTWCMVISRRVRNIMSRTHRDTTHSQGDMTHYYMTTTHTLGTIRCVLGAQGGSVRVWVTSIQNDKHHIINALWRDSLPMWSDSLLHDTTIILRTRRCISGATSGSVCVKIELNQNNMHHMMSTLWHDWLPTW